MKSERWCIPFSKNVWWSQPQQISLLPDFELKQEWKHPDDKLIGSQWIFITTYYGSQNIGDKNYSIPAELEMLFGIFSKMMRIAQHLVDKIVNLFPESFWAQSSRNDLQEFTVVWDNWVINELWRHHIIVICKSLLPAFSVFFVYIFNRRR